VDYKKHPQTAFKRIAELKDNEAAWQIAALRTAFSMPAKCPVCGAGVYKEGAYYFCSAPLSCRAQLEGKLGHFASRQAMNIEGLGHKTIRQLIGNGMVREIADLYRLSPEALERLEGFAVKSAKKLHAAIHQTKSVRPGTFVYALGIRHVGEHTASILAQEFETIESMQKADMDRLQQIPDVGPETAKSIVTFF